MYAWSERVKWRNLSPSSQQSHVRLYYKLRSEESTFKLLACVRVVSPTGLRCMTELLDMTVWSPSIRSSSLRLSWAASFRLLTELLWELALIDMLGMDWLLPTLFTVPVRPPPGSRSWRQSRKSGTEKDGVRGNKRKNERHRRRRQTCIQTRHLELLRKALLKWQIHLCAHMKPVLVAQVWMLASNRPHTSSASWASEVGPLWASWRRIFFIFRYCRLSSSRTASLVLWMRSISTESGRSRCRNSCCGAVKGKLLACPFLTGRFESNVTGDGEITSEWHQSTFQILWMWWWDIQYCQKILNASDEVIALGFNGRMTHARQGCLILCPIIAVPSPYAPNLYADLHQQKPYSPGLGILLQDQQLKSNHTS